MIEAGHSKEAILNYTIDEIEGYVSAIGRRESEKLKMQLIIQRVAAHGDQATMNKLNQALDAPKLRGENLNAIKQLT